MADGQRASFQQALVHNGKWLTAAAAMIATDPALERREHAAYRERIVTRYERGFELFRVG